MLKQVVLVVLRLERPKLVGPGRRYGRGVAVCETPGSASRGIGGLRGYPAIRRC